ncbi:hypothetical protein [Deinococcus pimensis]|uniref:hypothetical protein n=1 Tax=Deinococcus pimensis TaxID=309888 RepID=UPI0005EB5E30|nr:hypothetical protein [Deinococcus pimensis]
MQDLINAHERWEGERLDTREFERIVSACLDTWAPGSIGAAYAWDLLRQLVAPGAGRSLRA